MLSVTQSVWVPELSESRYSAVTGRVNILFPYFTDQREKLTMNIEDKSIGATVRILDFQECRSTLGRKCGGRRPVIARKKDHLSLGPSTADTCHDGLDGVCPFVDVGDVVGLYSCYFGAQELMEYTCWITSFMIPNTIFVLLAYLVAS